MSKNKTIRLQVIKSVSGRLAKHVACLRGLGLKRLGQSIEVEDTPCNRGMINKISYLLLIEE